MQTVRTLFNAAKENHNDEERNIIAISHNPFKKYKIPEPGNVEKRNLPPATIIKIRDIPDFDNGKNGKRHGQNRVNLGRDVFMLSFYLMGINIIDLFTVEKIQDGRLVYNRTKTETNKKDRGSFSVKIPDEAFDLLDWYKDPSKKRVFNFYKLYADEQVFTRR